MTKPKAQLKRFIDYKTFFVLYKQLLGEIPNGRLSNA